MKISWNIKRMCFLYCILLFSSPIYPQTVNENLSTTDTIKTKFLEEVVVEGTSWKPLNNPSHLTMSGAEINRRPALFGERDVIKALQSTSGVVSGNEGFAGLYVRGGETDQNLYMIDGLPLLNIYHLGGLFSTFNTYSIDKLEFYKGSFPAIFYGRASSILDISLKTPDYEKTKGIFSLGLISGQLYLSVPVRKNSSALSLSLRRTWSDIFSIPALAIVNATKKGDGLKTIFNYNFTDVMLKFSAIDRYQNNTLLVFFYGKDIFKLGEERFEPENDNIVYKKDLNKMSWGNIGFSGSYRIPSKIGELTLQSFITRTFSQDSQYNFNLDDRNEALSSTVKVSPSVMKIGLKETFRFPIGNYFEGLAGMQQTWSDYRIGYPEFNYSGDIFKEQSPKLSDKSKNGLLSEFAELIWNVKDKVEGSAGLRLERYLSDCRKHWNLEPRINLSIKLPYESGLNFGYSRIVQYSQQVSSNYMYLPTDAWLPIANLEKPLKCDVFSLGYFKKFKSLFNLKSELWMKRMYNLAEYKTSSSISASTRPWYEHFTLGKGLAYGLDIEIEGGYGSVNWNLSYGLMWNWRKFSEINNGKRFPAKFDNRNKIDIGVGWKINKRMELTGQWEFMTGNRMTLALYNTATPDLSFPDSPFVNPMDPSGSRNEGIDYVEKINNVRMPAFHRLNLNLSLKGRINKRISSQWDFGLYNVYCRMNPFSIIKSYIDLDWNDKTGNHRKFKTLSILPVLPSVSYTIFF